MIDPERFHGILERVYEAAARPELWRSALGELAAATNGYGAMLLHHRPEGAALHAASESMDSYLRAFFAEGWNRNNPWEMRARQLQVDVDSIVTDEALFDPAELRRGPWWSFLERFGLENFLSFSLTGEFAQAPFILTVQRLKSSGRFTDDEQATFKAALPHFRRAARLTIAVGEAAQGGMIDAFSALDKAAVLLDDLGRVVRLNAPAEELLGDGLSLTRGRLRASATSADRALAALVASVCRPDAAIATPSLDAIALRREYGPPLVIQAAPLVLAARDIFQRARAILVITRLHRLPEVGEAILQQAFGLTPAEIVLARHVVAGRSMPMAAAKLGVSAHTVRGHLKSMFAKTRTKSQSELAVLLSRLGNG